MSSAIFTLNIRDLGGAGKPENSPTPQLNTLQIFSRQLQLIYVVIP